MVLWMRTVQLKLPQAARRPKPDFKALAPRFDTGATPALGLASPFKIVR